MQLEGCIQLNFLWNFLFCLLRMFYFILTLSLERGDIDLKNQNLNDKKCKHFPNREIYSSEDIHLLLFGFQEIKLLSRNC